MKSFPKNGMILPFETHTCEISLKPSQSNSDRSPELRERILQIAGECVDQFGLRGTTILKIAEMVGVSRQTVHSYFPTKNLLIGQIIFNYMMDGINQTHEKIDLTKPAQKVVEDAMRHMLKHMQKTRGLQLMDPANREIAIKAAVTQDIVTTYATKLWLPILTHLQKKEHIRPGVDLTEIGKWLFLVNNAFLNNNDWLKSRDLHRFIETFVVPSVLRD